jgi:hypothetical protein
VSSLDADDLASRVASLRPACDAPNACACLELAATLETFDGRAEALGEAARHYEHLCEASTKSRCAIARAGQGPGSTFASRTNAGNSSIEMLACYNWSQMLARGVMTGPDYEDAKVLEQRACAGGLTRACSDKP